MPLSIKLRLSFRSAFSILRSSRDRSRLIDTCEEASETFFERTSEASKVLKNLTRRGRGRVLFGLNFPNL